MPTASADSVCAAFALLPESSQVWRAPLTCTVVTIAASLHGPAMLDAIVAAFDRYGAPVQHMFPEQLSTRITLWRVYARRGTTQHTIDSASWRTTTVPAEERVTAAVLLIDQSARIVAVSASAPLVRARVVAHLDSALQARSRRLAGY